MQLANSTKDKASGEAIVLRGDAYAVPGSFDILLNSFLQVAPPGSPVKLTGTVIRHRRPFDGKSAFASTCSNENA